MQANIQTTPIRFRATFDKFTPINAIPHMSFSDIIILDNLFISCEKEPKLISKLTRGEQVEFTARLSQGTRGKISLSDYKFKV